MSRCSSITRHANGTSTANGATTNAASAPPRSRNVSNCDGSMPSAVNNTRTARTTSERSASAVDGTNSASTAAGPANGNKPSDTRARARRSTATVLAQMAC